QTQDLLLRSAHLPQRHRLEARRLAAAPAAARRRAAAGAVGLAAGYVHGHPLRLGPAGRLLARRIHAARAHALYEGALGRPEPQLDEVLGRRLAQIEEPLPLVPLYLVIEVAVRVGAVEDAAGDVVDAHVQPRARAAGAQGRAHGLDRVVRHLPVHADAVGIDR